MWKIPDNRYKRLAARLVKTAGALALVWLVLAYFLLPPLIHRAARNALGDIGLADIEFKVRAISLFRTELEDLEFAPGQPSSIQAISLAYSPASLLRGRIESIRLTGAEVQLAWHNGQVDLSRVGFKTSAGAAQPSGRGSAAINLPLDRIELRASALKLAWENSAVWIPVSGVVEQGVGVITFDLRATLQNAPIELRGSLTPANNHFQIVVKCAEAEAASLLAVVPREALAQFPALASGKLKLSASYQQSPTSRHTTIDLEGRDLRATAEVTGQRLSLANLSFSTRAELDANFGLSAVKVGLRSGEVRAGPYTLQGVSGKFNLTGSADRQAINLQAGPGSELTVQNLVGVPQVRWTKNGDDPLVRVRIVETPATLLIPLTGDAWKISAPRAEVTTATLDLLLPQAANASRATFTGPVSLDASAAQATLRTLDNAAVSIGSVRFKQQGTEVTATDLTAALEGPLLFRPTTGLSLAGSVSATRGATLTSPNFNGSTGKIQAAARIKLPLDAPPSLAGQVDIETVNFTQPGNGLSIKDATLTLPFALNAEAPKPGAFEIAHALAGKEELPPLKGTLLFHDGKLEVTADVALIKDGNLHVAATADTTQSPPVVSVKATLPKVSLADKSAVATLAPVLKGYDVTGGFSANADLHLRGTSLYGFVTLNIEDARLENKSRQWVLDGVNGAVTFDGFHPIRSRPGQRISVKSLQLGGLKMSDAVCALRMDDPDHILIEEIIAGFAGGRVFTNSVVFDRSEAKLTAFFTGDQLRIEQIAPLMLDHASGSGVLYGRLPVEIHWPQKINGDSRSVQWNEPQLALGEGFLYATPDGGGLKIGDAGKVFDQYIAAQNPRFQAGSDLAGLRNDLVTALTDMDYTTLRIDFVKEQGFGEDHLMAKAFIAGRGANKGPTIGGFTANIHSFDEGLRLLLGLRNTLAGFGD